MSKKLVVILTKFPEICKVKTRLAKDIWFEKATYIQSEFIKKLIEINYIKNNLYDLIFCLNPSNKTNDFSSLFNISTNDIFSVEWNDLWIIMSNIFDYWLIDYDEVVLVGSDIPKLNFEDFRLAFDMLNHKDVALWPTFDWWYYLIWMKTCNKELFQNIIYSTETVLDETIEKCKINNLTFSLLEKKNDIDTYNDLLEESKKENDWFYKNLLNE